jgi:iron complex transport system ATP-binding protein
LAEFVLLQAADVEFAYGTSPVLRGVSLEIPGGASVGILGPNGSGKTTMLKVLAGTLKPSRGAVSIDGHDISRLARTTLARRMAVVPQETHLAFDYTVLEIVLMGRYPHLGAFEIEGPADLAIAREALAATGTAQFEDRPFATLSGGEKQRVIVAAALAQLAGSAEGENAFLLLDEPTAALDLSYQLEISALLRDLQKRRPITIIVSTHDLNFAAAVCQSLVLLSQGRILAAGSTSDVLTTSNIRSLYGVDAEVRHNERAGHVVVVPLARVRTGADA